MSTRLDQLVAVAREDLARRRRGRPPEELEAQLGDRRGARRLSRALAEPGLALIAEFKRRSPSAGGIRTDADVEEVVAAYERGGAAALSVLTDAPSFGGSLEDLSAARAATALPLLQKDFVVDPYQLHEALLTGADGVLLIVAALDDGALRALHEEADGLGLDCLVEVHDEHELERALARDAAMIGINNRDLRDLSVDLTTAPRLASRIPPGKLVVAESGYERRDQLAGLGRHGVAAVLVGESLMRAGDPEAALRELAGS